MMILTKDGFIYKSVPNIIQKKDKEGNWHEVQDGMKTDGIPLMKVVMFDTGRSNTALDSLMATGLLLES